MIYLMQPEPQRHTDIPNMPDQFRQSRTYQVIAATISVRGNTVGSGVVDAAGGKHTLLHLTPTNGENVIDNVEGLTVDFNPAGVGFRVQTCREFELWSEGRRGRCNVWGQHSYDVIIQKITDMMRGEYTADNYNLLTRNCQHFVMELYGFLIGTEHGVPIPREMIDVCSGIWNAGKMIIWGFVCGIFGALAGWAVMRVGRRSNNKK
ncbi:hypothetical protein BLNAU_20977 [Blattamonas nauphoetae]|uniref:PPPDE domain-containing protein n=1 Tax=Blattamonas nauphoetae TaxID=2049346 RepID=A0ABQ9WX65_9EUKA|nr:hypothetical protein BLNAU_20977 [Blattamonas nauphoetae]